MLSPSPQPALPVAQFPEASFFILLAERGGSGLAVAPRGLMSGGSEGLLQVTHPRPCPGYLPDSWPCLVLRLNTWFLSQGLSCCPAWEKPSAPDVVVSSSGKEAAI